MKYRSQRHATSYVVVATLPDGKKKCILTNINETGGRLKQAPGLKMGDTLSLSSTFGQANGIVKWANGETCGIEFRPRITKQLVDAFRHGGAAMTGPRFPTSHLKEMR